MKVLLINCVSDRPEVHLYLGLKRAGVDLSLILDPRDTAADVLRQHDIPVLQHTIRNRFDFGFDRMLGQRIAAWQPDIIHAPTSRGLAAALRVTRNTPIPVVSYRGTLGNLSHWSLPARLAHLHPRIAAIFCNCKAVQSYLRSLGIAEERLPVVYKGHDLAWYQPEERLRLSRSDLSISDSSFVVGCFANIRPLKGVDVLVRGIERLRQAQPHVVCLLVGECRDRRLERYIKRHNLQPHVRLLGFRNDVSALMPLCDVTVMPSVRREGFPRAIVESYSAAVPVICSDIGGMPEIVQDGRTGLVVPPGDSHRLAEALAVVATDPERFRQAGIAGREIVRDRLSLETYISSTIAVYADLIR